MIKPVFPIIGSHIFGMRIAYVHPQVEVRTVFGQIGRSDLWVREESAVFGEGSTVN